MSHEQSCNTLYFFTFLLQKAKIIMPFRKDRVMTDIVHFWFKQSSKGKKKIVPRRDPAVSSQR